MADFKISKHMWASEATCHCGKCTYKEVSPLLLEILDDVRDFFGAPLTATCMVRCDAHNKEEGGAPESRHLPRYADAADIKVKGVEPEIVFAYIQAKYPEVGGLHYYNTFTHCDTRGWPARW